MTILYLAIIAISLTSLLFISWHVKPIQAANTGDVEIQNIQVLPHGDSVAGNPIRINATLVNNSPNPILVSHGACSSPFSVAFDNHVLVKNNDIFCTLQLLEQRIDPGKSITATSPGSSLLYLGSYGGTANASITFPYEIWNPGNQTYSKENATKLFSFTIYNRTKIPTLSQPEKQAIIDAALAVPGLQGWSHDWQFFDMAFMTENNRPDIWRYAVVNLRAPSSSTPLHCNHDSYAMITVDMTTMKVVDSTYPTMESHSCQVAVGGGPGTLGGPADGETGFYSNTTSVESPLKQFKSGIKAEGVKCNFGLQLIFKTEDETPACVSQQTKEQLLKRGWGVEDLARTGDTVPPKTNELEIDLANQTFEAGYPVDIDLKNVNQDYGCRIPSVTVREESSQSLVFGPTPERDYGHSHCADPWDVTFYAGLDNNSLVTKPTRYQIIATLANMTYQKEFTAIPSNYSGTGISSDSSQVLPGFLTFTSCLPISDLPPNNGTVIGYSGFGLYHRYLAGPGTGGMEFDDYLLRPGQTGSFVMQVHQGQSLPGHNLAEGLSFLSVNLLNVDNSTVWKPNIPLASDDHPGLDVSYSPVFAVAGPEGYATITVSISARQDAPQGSYWLYLPPGVCGGHRVLLTVGDKPLSQPPDYIGYNFDSSFVVDTAKRLVFELINPGIHTFENCTLGYTSKNQTTIVKTFDVIPPGMEYRHIWNASSDQIDKRFLECRSPHITKVYPDMIIDGLAW